MPLTTELYPGKIVHIDGKTPKFGKMTAPSYNGTLNKYAGSNLNSTTQFKVFQQGSNGEIMSQNQALINQDNYTITQNNHDLNYQINNFQQHPVTYAEKYDLIIAPDQIKYPKPIRNPLRNGPGV